MKMGRNGPFSRSFAAAGSNRKFDQLPDGFPDFPSPFKGMVLLL
jgi:hypothetical protein